MFGDDSVTKHHPSSPISRSRLPIFTSDRPVERRIRDPRIAPRDVIDVVTSSTEFRGGEWMAAVEFRLLGPFELVVNGRRVDVPPKQRVLLAVLLLRANQPVRIGELIQALWDAAPPVDPRGTVQKYVMRLRRLLDPAGCTIHTESEAYRLELGTASLDVRRFQELTQRGMRAAEQGLLEVASAQLADALELWRASPPLSDVMSDALHRDMAVRLVERYLQVVELRIDLDLQLGRHTEVCAELLGLIGSHPLRERFWAQWMRALSATGRQGEALEAYRQVTRVLAEELGVDPGPELRATHLQILNGVTPPGPLTTGRVAAPRPRQLPVVARGIVGRRVEIDEVVAALRTESADSGARLVLVTGPDGIGKTTVAVAAAHRLVADYPDGQLFIELGLANPTGVDEALAYALRSLGVHPELLPTQRADTIAMYRSLTAERRLLIVLDGATSEELVRALLPGSPTSAVLVTTVRELHGILASPGARRIELAVLAPDDANEVVRSVIGEHRMHAEPDAVARIVEACGGLPLALRTVAARLATRPSAAQVIGSLARFQGRREAG
jgi:DNA-binding SARP family transcriptional activator